MPFFFAGKYFFFWNMNSRKVNYFLMFGSVMKNNLKLKHFSVFSYVMKNELKNNLLMFYFFKYIKIMRNKSYKLKSSMRIKLKNYNFINYLK